MHAAKTNFNVGEMAVHTVRIVRLPILAVDKVQQARRRGGARIATPGEVHQMGAHARGDRWGAGTPDMDPAMWYRWAHAALA